MKINGNIISLGENAKVNLNVYYLPTGAKMEIPVHVFRSKKKGPTLLLQAGMHGDEINGIEIIRNLLKEKYFENLERGSVVAIPIVNVVSFLNSSRELPDGRDLNRCFPGTKRGSLGSRIAYDMIHKIIPQIDFGVDFHTGGHEINNYPQVRCVFDEPKSVELAKAFGAPFILNSPYRDKSLRKESAKKGKQILVYESGESNRFNTIGITEGINGCLRLLKSLKMLDVSAPKSQSITLNDSKWIRARISGLFRTTKKFGTFVEKDQLIGTVSSPYADLEKQLIAPTDGFLIGINNKPVVNEGDALIHIGTE
ncbi:MAG: succinylglutamate desuccinylase/aspartoacylase family protein [Bacteroidetes bacterium]|nr:succinylglutamate desuccinylase/aspartoacylase family protein [Bacteroidota bacterium]